LTLHRKKIFILLPAMNDGGAERALVNLATALTSRGYYQVKFLLLRREGVYLSQINPDIEIEGLGTKGDVLFSIPALIKILKEQKPDILLTSLPICDLMAIWACLWLGKAAPVHICNIQNMRAQQFKTFKTLRAKIKAKAMLFFYARAQYFSAVSHAIAQELETVFHVPRAKISIIPNSLNLSQVQQQKDVKPGHKWLEPGRSHKTIIAVGRLVEQKDYPTLLRAIALLRETENIRLIILGEGPEKDNIKALIAQLNLHDDVDLAGFHNNPFSYVAASDVFVLSSAWEGFGNVIIEALSVGTPVVATNCPGAPAEILNNGEFGHLVPVADAPAICAALKKTIHGDRPAKEVLIGRAAEYSIEAITDLYESTFKKVSGT